MYPGSLWEPNVIKNKDRLYVRLQGRDQGIICKIDYNFIKKMMLEPSFDKQFAFEYIAEGYLLIENSDLTSDILQEKEILEKKHDYLIQDRMKYDNFIPLEDFQPMNMLPEYTCIIWSKNINNTFEDFLMVKTMDNNEKILLDKNNYSHNINTFVKWKNIKQYTS
jgi:hypothetical protein